MSAIFFSLNELATVVRKFRDAVTGYRVFAFHGEMGAGKTTFIHALCEDVGVEDTVSSPTFSIINEYYSPNGSIYHMDLYRLRDEEEAIGAGVEDALYSGNICLVEWPERAPGIFPEDTVHVYLERAENNLRKLDFQLPA